MHVCEYDCKTPQYIGALGVSGDTSCADHNIAWGVRKNLALNGTPVGDNIKYNTTTPPAAPDGHAACFVGITPPQ